MKYVVTVVRYGKVYVDAPDSTEAVRMVEKGECNDDIGWALWHDVISVDKDNGAWPFDSER